LLKNGKFPASCALGLRPFVTDFFNAFTTQSSYRNFISRANTARDDDSRIFVNALVFAEQLLIIAITKTTGDNFGPTLGGNAMRAACDYKTHN
jgi:hypothetical protein